MSSTNHTTTTTTNTTKEQAFKQNEGHLAHLRDQLSMVVMYIEDHQLRHEVIDWIESSHDDLEAGDVEEFIETQFSKLKAEYKMHDHDGVDNPEDAFPDACQGCQYYGGGCAVVTQQPAQDALKRIADESDSEAEFKRGVRNLADTYGCHRIPEWLQHWEGGYSDKIQRGWQLYRQVDVEIHEMDTDEVVPVESVLAGQQDEEDQ